VSGTMRPSGEYAEGDRKTFFLDALSNPFRGMGFLSLTIEPPLSMMTCFWVLAARFFLQGRVPEMGWVKGGRDSGLGRLNSIIRWDFVPGGFESYRMPERGSSLYHGGGRVPRWTIRMRRQFYVSGEVGFLHFFFMLVIGQPKIIDQRCGHIRRCAILPVVAIKRTGVRCCSYFYPVIVQRRSS